MASSTTTRTVVESFFRAMQAGPDGLEALVALFAEDATYIEPFSGQATAHQGRGAIRAFLTASQQQAPPDMVLTVERIDVEGDEVRSEWSCASPIFPAPMRGRDTFSIRDGLIARLETALLSAPPGA